MWFNIPGQRGYARAYMQRCALGFGLNNPFYFIISRYIKTVFFFFFSFLFLLQISILSRNPFLCRQPLRTASRLLYLSMCYMIWGFGSIPFYRNV